MTAHRVILADHEPALSRDWRLLGTVERCAGGVLAYTGTAERAAYPEREWHYEEVSVGKGRKQRIKTKRTTANKQPAQGVKSRK